MPPIIEAHQLRKTYGDLHAVKDIDFHVDPGEFFGMLGPNGAGKTTAIRMISCVTPPTAGKLHVDGLDVEHDDRQIKARLGVVPQDDNLDEDLTVRRNLEVYARYYDIPRAIARTRIDEGLELMQLSEKSNERIHALSGGMKRRLIVARALVNEPRILVLDEPTTGLDPQARHLVWRKLRLLRERGVTILLTTHYMDEAQQLCDRLVIMDHGIILDQGRPRDLIAKHVGSDVLELHLNTEEQRAVAADLELALAAGARLEQIEDVTYVYDLPADQAQAVESRIGDPYRVQYRRANLEDVFLTLTGRILVE
ncbi:MAG: ABC transporter ATP-binding protein [Chloroflexi bacterium]|nr:ABC transporter ATP-binding protein [Chloroflexota bacterium]